MCALAFINASSCICKIETITLHTIFGFINLVSNLDSLHSRTVSLKAIECCCYMSFPVSVSSSHTSMLGT